MLLSLRETARNRKRAGRGSEAVRWRGLPSSQPLPAGRPGGGGAGAVAVMGCCFSRRGKPAQEGQQQKQQQEAPGGAGQDEAAGEKAPQYSWDQRAKVSRRLLFQPWAGVSAAGLSGSAFAPFCRLG